MFEKRVCAFAYTQKTPNLRYRFRKRRLTSIPRHHRLADGQLSSLYLSSPSFSSFGAASAMLCCSSSACSGTPSWPSEYHPSFVENIMCIQTFCEHLNVRYIFDQTKLYCVEVRLELNGPNARLIVSPPSRLRLTPRCHRQSRWPALTTLPPFAKVQIVWRRLWEALLSSSLAGHKHPSLPSRLV